MSAMRILLLGRKHIAKCEDMISAIRNIGVSVDALLFPGFHYSEGDGKYLLTESSGRDCAFPILSIRSRIAYYAYHFFRILILLAKHFRKNRYDILFAVDWFEGVMLLVYRSIFARRAKVIFYSYDYYFFSRRCSSRFLINKIDEWVARHADEVWVVNNAIRVERERRGIYSKSVKTVPLGIVGKLARHEVNNDNRHFLFVGNMKPGHNLPLLVDAFLSIAQEDSRFCLTIVGKGNLEGELRERMAGTRMNKHVRLRGFVPEKEILAEISSGIYAAGIALYEDMPETRAVDPGKVKDYLSWGLPVITTPFNPISREISARDIGYIVPCDSAESLKKFFLDIRVEDLRKKQQGIGSFVSDHSFESIFRRNFLRFGSNN